MRINIPAASSLVRLIERRRQRARDNARAKAMRRRLCSLQTEGETWVRRQDELLKKWPGKHVVIKGRRVSETAFDSHREALSWGYRTYGYVGMMIRHLVPTPPVI